MRKITLASALTISLILAACGGGGSDGGNASNGNTGAVVNGGSTSGNSGAGTNTNSNTNGNTGSGGTTNPSGNGGTSGSGGSGSGGSGSGGSGSGGSGSGGSGSGGSGSGGSGSGGSGSGGSGSGGSGSGGSGSGGSGSGGSTDGGGSSANIGNTIPVVVSSATAVRNFPLVSVTICKPSTGAQTSCATIPNVLLDTGSFGLRLYASAIPAATLAALPLQTDPASGKNVAACAAFGSGYTWGGLRNADVKLGGEIAPAVPIQVIADSAITSATPSSCVWNTSLNSPSALGANGILGVGVSRYDCGAPCAGSKVQAGYYYADANPATPISMPLANQVTNPVALFPVDNNGLIVQMPAVSGSLGDPTSTGTVTFGIDTQANNALANTGATVFNTDAYGNFSGSYNGNSAVTAFIDSGSNSLNFEDRTIPQQNAFYAPWATLSRSVALTSSNGSTATVGISIANVSSLFATVNYAFSNLASYLSQTIDLGLPFFYGRRVYYGIANTTAAGCVTGPYVAFVP
jgi:hypothetical protein